MMYNSMMYVSLVRDVLISASLYVNLVLFIEECLNKQLVNISSIHYTLLLILVSAVWWKFLKKSRLQEQYWSLQLSYFRSFCCRKYEVLGLLSFET